MADKTATFGGHPLGDNCQYFVPAVLRVGDPETQAGVLQTVAKIDDQSPNILYQITVWVHKGESGPVSLAKWLLTIGALATRGKQDLVIEAADGTLTMEEAVLMTPVQLPSPEQSSSGRMGGIPLVFRSEKKPK